MGFTRMKFQILVLRVLTALCFVSVLGLCTANAIDSPPNVVVIMADDQECLTDATVRKRC